MPEFEGNGWLLKQKIMPQLRRNLILLHKENTTPQHLQQEVHWLNNQLVHLEKSDYFFSAHDIINVNKHKIYYDKKTICKTTEKELLKAFVFINNKN
jgi:hypothetical protein